MTRLSLPRDGMCVGVSFLRLAIAHALDVFGIARALHRNLRSGGFDVAEVAGGEFRLLLASLRFCILSILKQNLVMLPSYSPVFVWI